MVLVSIVMAGAAGCSTTEGRDIGADGEAATRPDPATSSTSQDNAPPQHKPGIRYSVRVLRDATLQVTQHVSLAKPTGSLALTLSSAALTRMGHDFQPRVHDLTVQATGQATQRLDSVLSAYSVRSVVFEAPTQYVTLRYTTFGAVHRSAPSSVGRALALIGVLGVSPTSGLSRTITVLGQEILNLGCDSPGGEVRACGKAIPHGWRVTLGPEQRGAAVFAQVELSGV